MFYCRMHQHTYQSCLIFFYTYKSYLKILQGKRSAVCLKKRPIYEYVNRFVKSCYYIISLWERGWSFDSLCVVKIDQVVVHGENVKNLHKWNFKVIRKAHMNFSVWWAKIKLQKTAHISGNTPSRCLVLIPGTLYQVLIEGLTIFKWSTWHFVH